VKLPFFKDILRYPTQPITNFAKEISDRVRVIACLDKIPNIIHSDTDDETISSANWMKIKKLSGFESYDALVIVWGKPRDVETAIQEIAIRAKEAIVGVPNETRQALPDGTTGFERILPGPDRMYPDTDLPPIALAEDRIQRIEKNLPPLPWIRREKYQKLGLPDIMIDQLLHSGYTDIFDRLSSELKIEAIQAAVFLTQALKHFKRTGLPVAKLDKNTIFSVFNAYKEHKIVPEAIPIIIEKWLNQNARPIEELIAQYPIMTKEDTALIIKATIQNNDVESIRNDVKITRFIVGKVMNKIKGKMEGKVVVELTKKILKQFQNERLKPEIP